MLGSTTPRLWTPPLRRLTRETSIGYEVAEFAEALNRPLYRWQRWLMIHAGELLPDGRPRFRTVLVLVSRQSGKTELLVIMALWWQFVECVPMILGTSTKLDYARESWAKSVRLADACSELDGLHAPGRRWRREANGEQESWTLEGSRYKIAASNAEGGRSLTVHRLILDELRQHHDYSAWDAAVPAMNAVRDGQTWAITNQGDDSSVVLNDLRTDALRFIETGDGDSRLGLFEWSAPEDASPLDIGALAAANPTMGEAVDTADLLAQAQRAVRLGGRALAGFRTEVMCHRVPTLSPPPIEGAVWLAAEDRDSVIEGAITIGVDVAPDRASAAVAVAGRRSDGLAHVELAATGPGTAWVVAQVERMLAEHEVADILDKKVMRRAVVGDAMALGPLLPDLAAAGIEPILLNTSDMTAACGSLQDATNSGSLRHLGQPELAQALAGALRRTLESGWAWGKRKSGMDISGLVAVTAAHWALLVAVESPAVLSSDG